MMQPSATRQAPRLGELMRRFPAEWAEVESRVGLLLKSGQAGEVNASFLKAHATVKRWQGSRREWPSLESPELPVDVVKARMEVCALEQCYKQLLAPGGGTLPLGRSDRLLAQHLFFTWSRERRTPSVASFRFWWRFVRAKPAVLSLLQQRGLYCIYSRELVAGIKELVGSRRCLEIGAGDGTLSLLLERQGVDVRATDDQSWSHRLRFPTWVEKLDGTQALLKYRPEAVVCSWPPPGNAFESQIFRMPSVELYVVVGSIHRSATSDWKVYENQEGFAWDKDERLTDQALPPEAEQSVLVFRRT